MIFLLIVTVLFAASIVITTITDWNFGELSTWILGFIWVCSLFMVPMVYYDTRENVIEVETTRDCVNEARKNTNIESAAIQQKIISVNTWLAQTKYYRKTIFKDFIPKFVDTVQFIK